MTPLAPATGAGMDGLRTDQAPPLSIPASFFLLAPLAMMASGAVIAWGGGTVFASRWAPLSMAATHLGTLGFLGAVMLGALYQMIPVVAGAPVPAVRLAHGVQAFFACGVGALVSALSTGNLFHFALATVLLGAAFTLFFVPSTVALIRAPTRNATVWGIRLAVFGLFLQVSVGIVLALARGGRGHMAAGWFGLVAAHAALGFCVWVGGLITAVSWQVVPMFYLTPPLPRWSQWGTVATLGVSAVGILCAVFAAASPTIVALAVVPAGGMVFWVHPFVTLRAIQKRRRKKVDGSVRFFWAGLLAAPLVPFLAAGAAYGDSPRWPVALAWVVIWGWAGMIAHGMLTRVVPFLVWFHRYASLVGEREVPSMRGLLPDPRIRVAAILHATTVGLGLLAIVSGLDWLARLTGGLLVATGALLGSNLVHTLKPRPLPAAPNAIGSASSG